MWSVEKCKKFLLDSSIGRDLQSSHAHAFVLGVLEGILENSMYTHAAKVQESLNMIEAFSQLRDGKIAADHGPDPAA